MYARSIALFVVAAVAEIGGAWLVWQTVREGAPGGGRPWGGLGLIVYGFVATAQADPRFRRVLAAYGGVFVAGSCSGASSSTDSGRIATT